VFGRTEDGRRRRRRRRRRKVHSHKGVFHSLISERVKKYQKCNYEVDVV
jgi:hypothetical protein